MDELKRRLAGLTPEKRSLLARRLRENRARDPMEPGIPRRENQEVFPLSYAQERLWFLDQLEPGSALYNIPAALSINGALDVASLEAAINAIIQRHDVLRATFPSNEGSPVQIVAPSLKLPLPLTDMQRLSDFDRPTEVARLYEEESRRPFDLSKGPLVRSRLIRLSTESYVLLLTLHHIVFDGWSTEVWLRETRCFYEAFSSGRQPQIEELQVQYADYAEWQRRRLSGPTLDSVLNYWKKKLEGIPALLEIPTDYPRMPNRTDAGSHFTFLIPPAVLERLKALSQVEGVTLYITLLAAFKTLLKRYSGQSDIFVGTPVANRSWLEVEPLIGFFVNTLVLRTDLSGAPSFRGLLHRVREVYLGAQSHQELPFEELVKALQPNRDLSYSPLFQVMFDLQRAPLENLVIQDLSLGLMEFETGISKFDLMLAMCEEAEGLRGTIEYACDLFNASTIKDMADSFLSILEAASEDPDRSIVELSVLNGEKQRRVLIQWNQTDTDATSGACIHSLIERQTDVTPDAIALVCEGKAMSYKAIDDHANQLANMLQSLGVGPEVLVGLCLRRSPRMVVAMLAVLKAGGAYVPIDPNYPVDRLSVMIEDARLAFMLTQEDLKHLFVDTGLRLVCLDTVDESCLRQPRTRPPVKSAPNNLAYVLFTSGSTGRPKGIAIEHRSVAALILWAKQVFDPSEMAGVLASTSISWDLSVFEIFATLSCGGTVLLVENALHLPELSDSKKVTLVNTVPSAAAELIRIRGIPESVRTMNLAGEPLPDRLVGQLYELPHIKKVYDLYGPGEDTTYSTFTLRRPSGRETVGRPISNSRAYILDSNLLPVAPGVSGGLFMAGSGLARGYYHRPELTAERFLPDPLGITPGSRLYDTGDLATYLPDGRIRFLGRRDHQVKIRGYRIELGDVKSALSLHPEVQEVLVIAREDSPGERRLVAYVVPKRKHSPNTSDLREFLKRKLPGFMIPSAFVTMDSLPLTPNGKIDRRALPLPGLAGTETEKKHAPPRNQTEELLKGIWADVLQSDGFGVFDSFFDLGGHSLLATQVMSRVRMAFKVDLPLKDLFYSPTVAGLAEKIETCLWAIKCRNETGSTVSLDRYERGEL